MITKLSQETIDEYASNATTIAKPEGTDYTQGAKIGKTIPAKWWNWIFRNVTQRVIAARSDAGNMLKELQNVVTDSGATLSDTDNTQLSKAVDDKANAKINLYINNIKHAYLKSWQQTGTIGDADFSEKSWNTFEFNNYKDLIIYWTDAVDGKPYIYMQVSHDYGVTWTKCKTFYGVQGRLDNDSGTGYNLVFDGTYYFLRIRFSDYTSKDYISSDGITWTYVAGSLMTSVYTNVYAVDNVILAVKNGISYSTEFKVSTDHGSTWTTAASNGTFINIITSIYELRNAAIKYGGYYVLAGMYSKDFITWNRIDATNITRGLHYFKNVWVDIVNMQYSSDLVTWNNWNVSSISLSKVHTSVSCITDLGHTLIIVGEDASGTLRYYGSKDGITWNIEVPTESFTQPEIGQFHSFKQCIAYMDIRNGYRLYISSLDGKSWNSYTCSDFSTYNDYTIDTSNGFFILEDFIVLNLYKSNGSGNPYCVVVTSSEPNVWNYTKPTVQGYSDEYFIGNMKLFYTQDNFISCYATLEYIDTYSKEYTYKSINVCSNDKGTTWFEAENNADCIYIYNNNIARSKAQILDDSTLTVFTASNKMIIKTTSNINYVSKGKLYLR